MYLVISEKLSNYTYVKTPIVELSAECRDKVLDINHLNKVVFKAQFKNKGQVYSVFKW